MTDDELDQTAESLRTSWEHTRHVLAECSIYVDRKAREGDPDAQQLAARIASAFDAMAAERIAAATLIHERETDDDLQP